MHAQDALGIPRGTIRATVLIETILAAFEMDEILYELREHSAGLNAGRWDYIFSVIKKFRAPRRLRAARPVGGDDDRAVHARLHGAARQDLPPAGRVRDGRDGGVHPEPPRPGGDRARRSTKVREDKAREAGDGFDGTWVAHPDLVPTATEEFDAVLGDRPNQIDRQRPDVSVDRRRSCSRSPETPGEVTEAGIRQNVSVGIRYLAAWLNGTGAAAIDNLMEDVATAEISRSQLWQWVHHGRVDRERVLAIAAEEVAALPDQPRLDEATEVFEQVALADEFVEFLTLPAYELL